MLKTLLRDRLSRWLGVAVLGLLATTGAQAQLTGPKTIPGTYATLAAAVTDLNTQGVGAGGVTFSIAAGYTETGNLLLTATGTAANPIVFQKSGTGANPRLSAGVGTTTGLDAIIGLSGSDYVTFDGIDVAESATNTTATTQAEFGYALFRASATDGCQNNIIRNCVVTLLKTNVNTIGIAGLTSTSAATTAVPATASSGANSNNLVYGNVVTSALKGIDFSAGSATTVANYDQNNQVGLSPTGTAAGNTVGNFGGTASGWGIGANYQNGFKASNNTINSTLNYTSATASTAVAASTVTSTLRGIYGNTGTSANMDIVNNTVTLASGGTTAQMSGIENGIGSTAASNTVNITGNTVTNCVYATATSATFYGILNSASAATVNITGNTVTNNTIPGSGTFFMLSGGSPTTLTISTNTLTGNSKSGTTPTSGSMFGIQALTAAVTVTGNTVNNNSIVTSGTSSGTLYGYVDTSSPTSETITGNTFTNLSIGGTTTATASTLYGIYTNPLSTTTKLISQNVVGGLSTTVAGTVAGIYSLTGATVDITRNKVYGLSASGAAGVVNGLYISTGANVTAANNLIGDLTAPAATGLNAVLGVTVAGGTNINLYFNTVYVNASSTGATFGTSGIYLGSTSAALDLRNNIVVNKSTANGTGGVTAALRRLSGTAGTAPANLAGTSNNNLYFAGTPSAANLIYVEGITATQTNAQQTLAAYKAFVLGREGNSVTEDVSFVSTTGTAATFLHVNTTAPTQVESGGTPVSGITTDFDGDTRNANFPDIGADEGTFVPQDLTGPTITFVPLSNSTTTTNRTLAVTIVDVSGISTTTPPRLFYRKGATGTFTSVLATSVSGSTYTFTFDFAAVGGVLSGDVIQYYVVAQDVPGNVGSSPAGNTFTTPALISSFTVLSTLSGTYYVGTSPAPAGTPANRIFATLTAAASSYSLNALGGAVTLLLLDNTYSTATGETFPIVFFNNVDASATNTLLVKPAAGVTATVTAAGSVLALAGTRYVTIDGSNGAGTSRDLTLTNTAIVANSYGLGLLTQVGLAPSNTFVAVRNVNIVGGGVTANATFGLLLSGADNDNVTLQNNSIQGVTTGIQAFGTASVSAGGLDNLVITGNVIGGTTASTATNINQTGIVVANALSPVISLNEVQNILNPTATFASNLTGILLQDVKSAQVSRNNIHDLNYTGTSTAKLYGISTQLSSSGFNTAANPSANRFDNNLVYRLNSTATSGSWNTSGINNNGGFGDQYYFNTVYLTGQLSNGSAGSAAFSNGNGITSTAATNIDVRNNIFSIVGGTGLAATPLYAHFTTLTTYAGSTLNYNDLYVTAGATGVARIGRIGTTDATTLADWRTATGQEANSLSVDPQFVQTTALPYDLTPANVALNNVGTPISGVTVDFTGATRGALPDLGAYEFTPLSNDLAADALLTPATGTTCYGPAETVSVRIRNAGTATLNFATTAATITVVVTPPTGATQTLTTTLTTGTLASNATQVVTLPGTLNMTAAGTYSFSVVATVAGDGNTSNDDLSPVPTRTVTAPVAGTLAAASTSLCISGTTTLSLTGNANGNVQLQQSTDNVTFVDVSGTTTLPFTTPVLTSTTYYRAVVSCNAATATSNVVTVTVNNPTVASVSPTQTICAGSTATLTGTASTGANVRFFSAATGGTALTTTTAGSFTTPALTASTTYYAEAFTGNSASVGALTNAIGAGATSTVSHYLIFDVAQAAVLTGVYVYPGAAGNVVVEYRSSTGTVLQSATVAVTAAQVGVKTLIPLGFNLAAGTAQRLGIGSSSVSLYRNETGASYPYTGGGVTITGNSFNAAYYYYYYDWQVGSECASATRTAIQVNVTQPGTASFPAATATSCGASPYTLGGTVGGAATTGTYTSSGTGTFSPDATTLGATYTPSAADITAGTATITLTTPANGVCSAGTATLTLTLSPAPVATFTYPTATICAGQTATVSPTLGTGATAGTFTSTTGLTITAAGVIDPATSTAGTYTVTNTIAASGNCPSATATASVTITPATTATFSYAGSPFCRTATTAVTPTITGTAGGAFSSTTGLTINATTGAITPSTSTAGSYVVTYAVTGTCPSSATQTVVINSAPVATFTYPTTAICAGQTATVTPTLGTGAAAGTFSSTTGLTISAAGVINPATSTAGTYTVTNTIAAAGGCAAVTATASVTITPLAVASFNYGAASSTFCVSGTTNPTVTLGTGATAGAFTVAPATGLTINATTGAITLSSSTPGTYTVTNTVAASGMACGNTATATVTITAAPVATFTYPNATICAGQTATVPATPGTGATAGTFSSTTGLTISAAGVINPATSTAGTYTVTNTIAAAGGCAAATATTTVTIAPRPATPTLTVVYNGANTTLTSSAATGNQFLLNGTAVAGATGQTYTVTGQAAQFGAYTVRTTNAQGCVSLPSAAITVTAVRNAFTEATLRAYPNPTNSGAATLELTGYAKAASLTVLNVLGQVVSTAELPMGTTAPRLLPVQLPAASGVYLLQVRSADGLRTVRVTRE